MNRMIFVNFQAIILLLIAFLVERREEDTMERTILEKTRIRSSIKSYQVTGDVHRQLSILVTPGI